MMRAAAWAFMAVALLARAEDAEPPPPFITTPEDVVERMLKLADTTAADLVVDLGSGDGRIPITAATKFGAHGLGIELDGHLVERSRENARRSKVADRVAFVEGDVLQADFSKATVVTVYLLPSLIGKLQPRFIYELKPGTRIVSHSFTMAGWKPDRIETMHVSSAHPMQGGESTLYLWVVPAEVRGVWRGGGWQLRIDQSYEDIDIEGSAGGKPVSFAGAHIRGSDISWEAGGKRFRGRVAGSRIVGELEEDGKSAPLALERGR